MIRFSLLDRLIFVCIFRDFLITFLIVFLLGASVDVLLNLDEFIKSASLFSNGDSSLEWTVVFIKVLINFQGPRCLEIFSQFHGLFLIIAMAFAYLRMHKNKELIAMLASGISLWRVGFPAFAVAVGLAGVQFVNQEFLLPNYASNLLRSHSEAGMGSKNSFSLEFVLDESGCALISPSYDPELQIITNPVFVIRNSKGRALKRISADEAIWEEAQGEWFLKNGRAIDFISQESSAELNSFGELSFSKKNSQEILPTSLIPEDLLAYEHDRYVSYLSLRQLFTMLKNKKNDGRDHVLQVIFGRLSAFLLNIILVGLVLPCFLIRDPAPKIILQIIFAFLFAILVLLSGFMGRLIPPDWFSPVFSSFLPVFLLMPWAVNRLLFMRT